MLNRVATQLPALPFGEQIAFTSKDSKAYGDQMARVISSLNACEPIGESKQFESKASTLLINGMRLLSCVNTPVHVDVGDTDDITLKIAFAGECFSTVGRHKHHWGVSLGAMFLPATARVDVSTTRSCLMLGLCPDRLAHAARGMFGLPDEQGVDLGLQQERVIPLYQTGIDFETIFRQWCSHIDVYCEQPLALEQMGMDDILYRNIVMLLLPERFKHERFAPTDNAVRVSSKYKLDHLCDYILENLTRRITLSDMERVSGLSARALQYAFLQRYQCTPMHWVRDARLDRARDILTQSEEKLTIRSVAQCLGFAKHSTFSALFAARFGETPSALTTRLRRS